MNLAIRIEDMEREAEVLKSMVLATYDAIYNSSSGYEEFEGAFYAVFALAHDHMEHLQSLTNEAYALLRTGKESEDE